MAGPWERYQQAQPVQISPADPTLAGRVAGQNLSNARVSSLTPLEVQRAQAEAVKAQAEASKPTILGPGMMWDARSRRAVPIPGMPSAAKPQMPQPQRVGLKVVENQLKRLQELYVRGPGATSGLTGILDFLPTPTNKQFDTAGAGLGEVGLSAFRVPGAGSQSDTELRAFIEANRPSSSDYDAAIQEKMNNLRSRVNTTYQAYGMKPPAWPTPRKAAKKTSADDGWKIERAK